MRFTWNPEALAEYIEAVAYYGERVPGLDGDFCDEIEAGIATVCDAPDRWHLIDSRARRYIVKRFPYALIYQIMKDRIRIVAVMHHSREPEYWKHRD